MVVGVIGEEGQQFGSERLGFLLVASDNDATPEVRSWTDGPPSSSLLMGTPVNSSTIIGPETKA